MSSLYLDKWEKQLNGFSAAAAIAVLCIFLCYEYAVVSRARAESFLKYGRGRIVKARGFSDQLLVEKSLLYQEGLVFFKRSIASNPLSPAAYYEFAETIVEIGSAHALRRAVSPDVIGLTGDRKEDYFAKALRYYNHAVERDPFCGLYHQRLGHVYSLLAEYPRADKEFAAAVTVDAQNVSIHLYLAHYYSQRKEPKLYEYHLTKVISLYNATLKGGGPISEMVREYFKSINREELIQ